MTRHTYTIEQKMSNTGSIHDIASDTRSREIVFVNGAQYAVVLAAYYGGRGYSTHRTESAAAKAAKLNTSYSLTVIDRAGREYYVNGNTLTTK